MLRKLYDVDFGLMAVSFLLLCAGLLMVYSSSAIFSGETVSGPFFYFKKQLVWTAISMVFFIFFLNLNYKYLQKVAPGIIIAVFLMLAGVLIFGKTVRGARRWFDFGPINFQPSEIAKFGVIIFLADYLDKNKSKIKSLTRGLLPALLVVGGVSGLIAMEPDFGTPLVICLSSLTLIFIAGAKIAHVLLLLSMTIPAVSFLLLTMPYVTSRVSAFLNPWEYARSASYQLIQSLAALGSGGLLGKGLGRGEIKRFYLPDMHTDFIFSIIGEEAGLLGTLLVVFAFVWFFYRGYVIARESRDFFGVLLALGITLTIVIQALFNIAVCCGAVPTKGISLPFFSYGGSSLIFTLSAVGVLLNISSNKKSIM
ncbi:MAG: putative lipid II flippase FtsW [Elusimicrobia bacterium]|nr:putative lipid II flippase FtsW [Elusimicrobiota bacterium]